MSINDKDISLYPMTMDIYGERTHAEYVDSMAAMLMRIMRDYRVTPETMVQLVQYADENWERLSHDDR